MGSGAPRVYAAIAFVLASVACSYDWSLRGTSSGDAGEPQSDGAAPEADSSVADADGVASDGGDAQSTTDAAPSCASLASAVGSAELEAKTGCTVGVGCSATVKDQCGCDFFVAQSSSQGTLDLQQALTAYANDHCASACGTCSPPTASVACLEGPTSDGGFAATCQEP